MPNRKKFSLSYYSVLVSIAIVSSAVGFLTVTNLPAIFYFPIMIATVALVMVLAYYLLSKAFD